MDDLEVQGFYGHLYEWCEANDISPIPTLEDTKTFMLFSKYFYEVNLKAFAQDEYDRYEKAKRVGELNSVDYPDS